MALGDDITQKALTTDELAKREGLTKRKPYVAAKLAKITEMEEQGQISPIVRLEKSYLCNFKCTHCSAEYYMDRHLDKVTHVVDDRQKMNLDDVCELSRQADELGLARFVITGGEPLIMHDFDAVVEAIDPEKHYIISDTNGWLLDVAKAKHLKAIGVEKIQLSLDSMIESEHDNFRNKPGSYKRVMRAIDASLDAGLNIILSTVLVNGRAKTKEFRDLCEFIQQRDIGLYVSYAKLTGSCTEHPELVISKEDADIVRQLEKEYKIFTHMTPSYGSFKGCITTKGIITVTSTMEVIPCPYIDMSLGNLRETPLKEILDRGMHNAWMAPYRPDCIIGEDQQFIKLHTEKTKEAKLLPLVWGAGFSDHDMLGDDVPEPHYDGLFDRYGRCSAEDLTADVHRKSRRYFRINQPEVDLKEIYGRITQFVPGDYPPCVVFEKDIGEMLNSIRSNPMVEGIMRGVYVPFILPRTVVLDEGQALEEHYLGYLIKSFKNKFPHYDFKDHHITPLSGCFKAVIGSRHEKLVNMLSSQHVTGIYFPTFTEFSIKAAVERIQDLPDNFILAGPIDTTIALIAAPKLLQNKKEYSPLLWLPGLTTKEDDCYCFEAYGYDLTFIRRVHFNKASEFSTCGISVVSLHQ